tara:strand:+ start:1834 stop:2292 length:459 start_codon:yes stop_codon:yes gene_type:complete
LALPLAWATGWIIGTGARLSLKVGAKVIKKPVLSAGGAILGWELFDLGGTKLGGWVEGEFGDVLGGLREAGVDVLEDGVEFTASVVIETIEKAGPAFLTGVENTFIALRESMRGREVNWLTFFTVTVLVILAGRFLWNTSRTAGRTIFDDSI